MTAITFQTRVQPWLLACFGAEIAADRSERNHRFLEESLELVQSCGCTASEAHQLVDYVFGRPVGEPAQEAGGVMVTLAALCLANSLDMHQAGETELARIWTKVEAIRAKQAAKPKHSPLPAAPAAVAGPAPKGWRLVPATPTRDWIAAVADGGYEDCDCASLIADILSRAPAAPALEAPAAHGCQPLTRDEIATWAAETLEEVDYPVLCKTAPCAYELLNLLEAFARHLALAAAPTQQGSEASASGPKVLTDEDMEALSLTHGLSGDVEEMAIIVETMVLDRLAAAPQAPAPETVAWLNKPIKIEGGEKAGDLPPTVDFKRHAAGHEWLQAEPLVRLSDALAYAKALAAAPQAPAEPSAIATQVIENLLQLARIVNTAVEDWGESFEDGSSEVTFHKEEADKLEGILEFFDSLPDAPESEGVILSGPNRAQRVLRAIAAPAAPAADATAEHAAEYNRWIKYHAAGDGDYDDFLRREHAAQAAAKGSAS